MIFSRDELAFLLKESTLAGTEEDGCICHLFFNRDRGMAEITLPPQKIDLEEIRIAFISTMEDTVCTKEELIQFLQYTRKKELATITVE